MRKVIAAVATSLTIVLTVGTGSTFAASNTAPSKLVSVVNAVKGTPYKMGGISTVGFDCSGFTKYVFKKFGVNISRSSAAQYKMGTAVSKSNLKEGDLVFFNTFGKGVSHVGIYIGNGKFAHASSSKGIAVDNLNSSYYKKRYVGAKRVLSKAGYAKYAASLT